MYFCFFFFSSRRRHTRLQGDWSSDVCSSDLHTGRTHQIRVHARFAGHPIAGDEKYGDEEFNKELRAMGLSRLFLHAHSIASAWPGSGEPAHFSAPLPAELRLVVDAL